MACPHRNIASVLVEPSAVCVCVGRQLGLSFLCRSGCEQKALTKRLCFMKSNSCNLSYAWIGSFERIVMEG